MALATSLGSVPPAPPPLVPAPLAVPPTVTPPAAVTPPLPGRPPVGAVPPVEEPPVPRQSDTLVSPASHAIWATSQLLTLVQPVSQGRSRLSHRQVLKCPTRFMQQVVQLCRQREVPVVEDALQLHEDESSVQTQCMQVQLPEAG